MKVQKLLSKIVSGTIVQLQDQFLQYAEQQTKRKDKEPPDPGLEYNSQSFDNNNNESKVEIYNKSNYQLRFTMYKCSRDKEDNESYHNNKNEDKRYLGGNKSIKIIKVKEDK